MELEYTIRKSHRAKRIILRVDHAGEVEVVVPWYVPKRFGHAFLYRRLPWVARVKKRQQRAVGGRCPLPEPVRKVLVKEYRLQAKEYFAGVVRGLAEKLGVAIPNIRIGDFKTQWGSCNRSSNTLSFSWRLLLAPEEVRRYVAAHEAAHLVHSNHSHRFWGLVEKLDPNFREARRWLKQQGSLLKI